MAFLIVAAAVIFATKSHWFTRASGKTIRTAVPSSTSSSTESKTYRQAPATSDPEPVEAGPKSSQPAGKKQEAPLATGLGITSSGTTSETSKQDPHKTGTERAKVQRDRVRSGADDSVTPFHDVYLKASLEQSDRDDFKDGFKYKAVTNVNGLSYPRGIYLRIKGLAGSMNYRIPRGAKTFVVTSISSQDGLCGNSDADGWEVRLTTAKCTIAKARSWQFRDPQVLEIPVDNLPEGILTITVNGRNNITCDTPSLAGC
jgi:hypothetical protein